MTRAIVLYHSLFGNTRAVAEFLAKGLERAGIEVDCLSIDDVDINQISNYDFLAIGGPTHILRMSKPMQEFLEKLESIDLRGLRGFAFDTRNESRMNKKSLLGLENSAARRIEGKMKRMKVRIIRPRRSAIVEGREGPLDEDVQSVFAKIGNEIGKAIV
ncbi:MAG: flavodoxin-like domain-containing protein [Candidatus Thorarchaeota archaeon]|nr:MAG: flavodoxin-like domain-containing protein [Candidatus Thorarchaeota archaeon]